MTKIKIGRFESYTTCIWKEGIEIELPEGVTAEEFVKDRLEEFDDEFEQEINEKDVTKEKVYESDTHYWVEDENGNTNTY